MNTDEVRKALERAGEVIVRIDRLPNGHGSKIDCKAGGNVVVYDSGKVVPQGKKDHKERLARALGVPTAELTPLPAETDPQQTVFVVYGHDRHLRDELEATLRRWKLEPLILDELPSEGATIIEKLEKYTEVGIHYGVVLATPDDEGHVRDKPDAKRFRARQNVVLELGMLLSRLGRKRVAILLKDSGAMERPSDIDGLIYLPFKERIEEVKAVLAKEMAAQGLRIPVDRL